MRRTRIVATIGPASASAEALRGLVRAGMDVARLNASHSDSTELAERLSLIRRVTEEAGHHVGVMLDLAGPKLRVGEVEASAVLETGTSFSLLAEECVGDAEHACVNYPTLSEELSVRDRVLVDDGRIRLRVTSVDRGRVVTIVETGGPLGSHKGVNVPGVTLRADAVTAKDEADLAWGIGAGIDFVAMSFVREAADVERLRRLMGGRSVPVVAKIEKHEAIGRIPDIVETADAVMVARGDLGVETSPEEVPVIQRAVIAACRRAGKPVIVATQMLESMVAAPRPTRAEASDVANAIFDEADAVMLSAETAIGSFAIEAVETMARVATTAEDALAAESRGTCVTEALARSAEGAGGTSADVTRAVSLAAAELASGLPLAAIVTPTQSGATARAVARHRPRAPIVAVTQDGSVARSLTLVWGVYPTVVPQPGTMEELLAISVEATRNAGLARSGDLVAVTAGLALNRPGGTDSIQVRRVP